MTTTPNDRDRQILHHVYRYRLTTREFLQREFFEGAGDSAVCKVVSRLVSAGWLRERRLTNGLTYYILGAQGRQAAGASAKSGRKFTEQSFPVAYGFLAFCSAEGVRRLTTVEFQSAFPELCRERMKTGGYYVDSRQAPCRLGTVLLDRGNPPKLMLRKLDRLLAQHYRTPAFATLIQSGRFCVTIMTAWPAKQRLLESAIKLTVRGAARIEVATVSELQAFHRRV
ncbi:MAG: hypothetical protein SGJ19_06825 [Planctomycetia bacterium]|nr:hypothetical protein [Planctomycetia bacterium]